MERGAMNSDSPLVLEHQMAVIDANLVTLLDESRKREITERLLDEIIEKLNMERLGPLGFYDAADLRAPGWSFVQPITTSHISGHYFEKPGEYPHIHLDIYTCKALDFRAVLDTLHEHLQLADWAGTFIHRDMDLSTRRSIEFIGHGNAILNEAALVA